MNSGSSRSRVISRKIVFPSVLKAWVEKGRYRDGSLAETSRWTAILTTMVQAPRTPDALRKNPLGIFVNAINWSKELGS